MTGIQLTPEERQALLAHDRRAADPDVRLRAHLLLLLDGGHPWATVSAVLFCSLTRTHFRVRSYVYAETHGK